ncbi:mannonate dehydratase [Pedobacter africanus]|uniref:Mannonate dehydratase n=1 Tax=Pedobacter africanus TaxID=151894 RepID=A0ACC6KVK4_9SPHI|nr:mannonate dehydratase [Pedobacter africanus]MDR6783230.1 mannonate dehydratase [Pedobacter africanus]
MEQLTQTFRWFGPDDEVTLAYIRQTGATGIVTALHHIPCGEEWSIAEIASRKDVITASGLSWEVVESVNIHESIKTAEPERDHYIEIYKYTLKNLAACGLKTVCYNFMPVLDWTRTHLDFRLPDNASALRYDAVALAAFDLFVLQRQGAFQEYTGAQQKAAKQYFEGISEAEKELLTNTIMAGLPGTDEVFTVEAFRQHLRRYEKVDAVRLRENLAYFLREVIPVAEAEGIRMCIHPDDPPFPILGLPRVVSTEEDLKTIVNFILSPSNGITFCSGSLGANPANDLPGMAGRLGPYIHFIHLRNVQRENDGSFYEAAHLNGSTDMFAVMQQLIKEQKRRENAGRTDTNIPMRPDHGHKILDDINRNTYPGYSVIGRMKGLAELRGLELGIRRSLYQEASP